MKKIEHDQDPLPYDVPMPREMDDEMYGILFPTSTLVGGEDNDSDKLLPAGIQEPKQEDNGTE